MGGEDVRTLQLRSLQEQISVVSQDTSLFNDTVAVSCISAAVKVVRTQSHQGQF